jgi:nucleoside-diphosphate-sugar epimerase
MKVLIIGGCGYIGSRLYLHLKEKGMKVATLDLEWFGNHVNTYNFKIDFGKEKNPSWYLHERDAVVLLAGHSSVPMCKDDMMSSFKNNVFNFIKLLDSINPRTKFIYASSSSVYGNTHDIEAPEDWERYDPKTYYDLQKQEIDYYARLSNTEYYGLRFGTVNGWSPNLRTDIMLNKMYESAIAEGKVHVFNKHIYRPILGIEDLCRAIEAVIKGPDRRGIYNLASFNASVEEIANAIKKALNEEIEIVDKGIAQTYNFSISTSKFKSTYNFEFVESVNSIVHSLKEGWSLANKTIRERMLYD